MGAVCLLVSWKVRGHSPISVQRLREYTDYTVSLADLLVSHYFILCQVVILGHPAREREVRRLAGDCHVLVTEGLTRDRQLSWLLTPSPSNHLAS